MSVDATPFRERRPRRAWPAALGKTQAQTIRDSAQDATRPFTTTPPRNTAPSRPPCATRRYLRTLHRLSHGGPGDIVPLNDLTLEWQHLVFSLERIRTAPDDAGMRRITSIPLSRALEVNGGKRSGGVEAGGVFRVQG